MVNTDNEHHSSGTALRAENTSTRTQNEVTKRTLVGTTKSKLENGKYELRTNLLGIEMVLS